MINKALDIAVKVHAEQKDKAGKPYILHPLRLMAKFDNVDFKIVALLHDVVEDSDITLNDLRQAGFKEEIVLAIDSLTRRQKETYELFIERIAMNRIARLVKLEDLKDNMDVTRLKSLSDKDLERLKKYHKSYLYLVEMKLKPV